jgi:Fe-S-cluster containining protein
VIPIPCRAGCGACCIAPSLSSPIPGMPDGKPAGARCAQLSADNRCRIFGQAGRPPVCASFQANLEMCGENRQHALAWLGELERATRPGSRGL